MTTSNHTCQSAFQNGTASRATYPLQRGEYKLSEAKNTLLKWAKEVQSIDDYQRGVLSRPALACCAVDEISSWLKQCPVNIAELIGYDILPGIAALTGDGVPLRVVKSLLKTATKQSTRIVADCEASRVALARAQRISIPTSINETLQMIDKALAPVNDYAA